MSVGHDHIRGSEIFNNIEHSWKLSERADRDTAGKTLNKGLNFETFDSLRTIAVQIGHEDVRGVRLQRDTVVPVVDDRILEDDIVAPGKGLARK